MANEKHSQRTHALLSASGSSRWLNCTPSARLEEKFQESNPVKSSVHADEGTLAHEFADIQLRFFNNEIDQKILNSNLGKLRKEDLYYDGMEAEVQKYVQIVRDKYHESVSVRHETVLYVEKRFDFSHYVEKGFGTGDATIIADGTIEIIDLKFGVGVKVDAVENTQLKLYALGALRQFDLAYDITNVRLTIIQPRINHISSFEITVDDLIEWGEKKVKPTAKKAYLGKGEKEAGEWCRWCKVSAMCRTLAEKNLELARRDFEDPHLLTDDEVFAISKQIPMLTDWANSVQKYILEKAIKGHRWPGLKLVEGRSNRKWIDEAKVANILIHEEKIHPNKVFNTKLKGIPAVEKLLDKADFIAKILPLIEKPEGKPTLAPLSDKRPELRSIEKARSDFDDGYIE